VDRPCLAYGTMRRVSMPSKYHGIAGRFVLVALFGLAAFCHAGTGDFDGNGYVDLVDYGPLAICLEVSGPDSPPYFDECNVVFDRNDDADVDLRDIAAFQNGLGHLPFPLRDAMGNAIVLGSSVPYSGRETCGVGGCHDIDVISNGFIHQQGRTDADGHIIMQDDFFADGRPWVRSAGMYGRWSGGGGGLNRQTAGKQNADESSMDMTAFYWAFNCGACHAGGGGMEFDRDGHRYWDEATGQFGYEVTGRDAGDVRLDGDYAFLDDSDGSLSAAPWDRTGVAGPECLHCHRADRTSSDGLDMHREWRAAVLATTTGLVDDQGEPVPSFAAAGTAGQGWFSTLDTEADPPVLQIDYGVGVANGDLSLNENDELMLEDDFLAYPPGDKVCWGCHLPGGFQNKRGTVWFDERDIHYKKFTNRNDDDPRNDLTDEQAATCNLCHPGGLEHDFTKGNSPYTQFRNEWDWVDFRSCRECHLYDSPVRHPDAPDVLGGSDTVVVHLTGNADAGPMAALSCQACHVPYPLERAIIVTDRALTGTAVFYFTDELLSADPLDPSDPDKSKWYPPLRWKTDSDGRQRLFPQKMEIAMYWADWDRNGTPEDMGDDAIRPVILWRLRQITGNQPLPVVTDDNGDGKLEVNRPEEMLVYMKALRAPDSYGRPVAENPVLVKGDRVWYFDPQAPEGVSSFDADQVGAALASFEIFGLDHNVLAKEEAWGAGMLPFASCGHCHPPPGLQSPVIDRRVLVDPFDADGNAVYKTVRELTGVNPP
jgi:hypothetical protein